MEKTPEIYGEPARLVSRFDHSPKEMMFWLYCPVKVPGSYRLTIPDNLRQYYQMLMKVMEDCEDRILDSYMYITAKTLYTTPENPGNRPGWHSDGFLTDDLNYIWCDANPTIFFHDGYRHSFTSDHEASLAEMDELCENEADRYTLPTKWIVKLDQRVLHKVDTNIEPGLRTFVKVSVSYQRYALEGNSINHGLSEKFQMSPRGESRNCPIGGS